MFKNRSKDFRNHSSQYIDHTVYVKEEQRWETNNAKDMYQNISYILLHNGNQVDRIYYGVTQA